MDFSQGRSKDEWLQSRQRLRDAAMTSLYTKTLWPEVSLRPVQSCVPSPCMKLQDMLPQELEERVYSSYKEHVEAAHALLRCTLALWEVEDLDGSVRARCKALVAQLE